MDAAEVQQAIIDAFGTLGDWPERYQYLLELGRTLPSIPTSLRSERHRLSHCRAQIWLAAERRGERLHFRASSDSPIIAGLIALLLQTYSDRTPAEILGTELRFPRKTGLDQHLSPYRRHELDQLVETIRGIAWNAVSHRVGAVIS